MIQIEVNKINHVEYIRTYSDRNHYLKVVGQDELLTEVMTLGKKPIDVIETDVLIEADQTEPRPSMYDELEAKINAMTALVTDKLDLTPAERERIT